MHIRLLIRMAPAYGWFLGDSGIGPGLGVKKTSCVTPRMAKVTTEQLYVFKMHE